jgi:hypothetical protein
MQGLHCSMIRFPLALLFAFSAVLTVAQVASEPSQEPPFNPDHDANGVVQTLDLMEVLSLFGQPFEAEITEDARVALLFSLLEAQHEELIALRALIHRTESPFHWDEEAGVWVAADPIEVQNVMRVKRLEAGSSKIGGFSTR